MKNLTPRLYRAAMFGMVFVFIGTIGIVRVEAATSIDDADSDTSVDVEATSDEDKIHFTTFGTERMTITNTGNVGIGTTSPGYALEIIGTVKADDLQIGDDTIRIRRATNTIEYRGGDGNITTETGDALLIKPGGTTESTFDANGLSLKSGASINEFSIDGTLTGDSDDAVPTERAVRTYVDNNAGTITDVFDCSTGDCNDISPADGELLDFSGVNPNTLTEGLIFPQSTSCASATAEGQVCWDSDDDILYVGNGTVAIAINGVMIPDPFSHMALENNTDDGTGANAVTDIGTPTYTSGLLNNALELDGSTDALNIDALESDITANTTGTIAAWINWDGTVSVNSIAVFGDTNADEYLWFYVNSSGQIAAAVQKAGVPQWTTKSAAITQDVWTHVMLVHDGVTTKTYVDGVEDTNFTVSTDKTQWIGDLVGVDNGRLGCANYNSLGNNSFFDGQIDDFRYYQNHVLTQEHITVLYNAGAGTEN